ncbi:hypothetical protein [Acinetobacter beijerinckii]|uniref:hypothetical protein n=1 Tax=Acinetobacter beijerinckii TaxID=262668 RepID=UPI0040551282
MQNRLRRLNNFNGKNQRIKSLVINYKYFLAERNLENCELSRMIFVENYINTLKFNIYDDDSKMKLSKEIEKLYPQLVELNSDEGLSIQAI